MHGVGLTTKSPVPDELLRLARRIGSLRCADWPPQEFVGLRRGDAHGDDSMAAAQVRVGLIPLAFLVLIASCLLVVRPARAYCSEPSAPYCATSYGSFDDEDDFDSCKRDMENFRSEVEDYNQCLANEARRAIDEARQKQQAALDEYNDAVSSFNRRARGY